MPELPDAGAGVHLPDSGHVYVGAASGDPISHIGEAFMTPPPLGLGADPAIDGFGSTRFKAEFSGIQFDHSHLEMTAPTEAGFPTGVGAVLPTRAVKSHCLAPHASGQPGCANKDHRRSRSAARLDR